MTDTNVENNKFKHKDRYSIQELFEELPCDLISLSKKSGIPKRTLENIRDGRAANFGTLCRLLDAMSEIYNHELSIRTYLINVTVNMR